MKLVFPLIILSLIIPFQRPAAAAAPYQPVKSPLTTRWTKDVDPKCPLADYPRPQLVREKWQNLNGLWQFQPADNLDQPPTGKNLADQILVPFCMESALSGIGKHSDHAWYRRTFDVPASWEGNRILLHFGAVDYETTVWLNGKKLGDHIGGYDAFSFDITDAMNSSGPQELIVGVADATGETQPRGKQILVPEGIFYTPCSGIWQTVWLEPVNVTSISRIKITPEVDSQSVSIQLDGRGDWKGSMADIQILDGDKVITQAAAPVDAPINVKIDSPRLWSPDTPFLYRLKISIRKDGNQIDSIKSYFGMRKIAISPDAKGIPRITLNGKEIMQVGPLDQGFWPAGLYTAPTDDALKSDLQMAKKLGFNCVRKHVKIEPQRWYYWADKLGLLVWQDMPSTFASQPGDWQKQFETELSAMVEQHFNSPAIIMWVPFNEGWGQSPWAKEGTKHIVDLIKKLDPSRLVDNASGWTDAGAGDVHDIHVYPGPVAPAIEKSRAIVLGEFGGLGRNVPGHMWDARHWGYQNLESQADFTDRYEQLLGRLWQLHDDAGLCAGIYTQISDVETESTGLLTYDRAVLKGDENRLREATLGHGPRVVAQTVVRTARHDPANWLYTLSRAEGWKNPTYNASAWKTGAGGFGIKTTAGAIVRTDWSTPDIWLRREIQLPADALKNLEFRVACIGDCEIYINGTLAAKLQNATPEYVEQQFRRSAWSALKPGKNLLAVHCHQAATGQYIDVGIVKLVEQKQ